MTHYQAVETQAILMAYKLLLANAVDVATDCHCNAYSLTALDDNIFQLDQLRYFKHITTVVPDRKVGFLFSSNDQSSLVGIILHYSKLDQKKAQMLQNLLAQQMDPDRVALTDEIVALIQGLYQTLDVTMVGKDISDDIIDQLMTPLGQAFSGLITYQMTTLEKCAAAVTVVEHMLATLKNDHVFESDEQIAARRNFHQCTRYFHTQLADLETTKPTLHREIITTLKRLFKLIALSQQTQIRYGIQAQNLAAIETIMQCHQNAIAELLELSIEIEANINGLPLTTLSQMLVQLQNPESLRDQLQHERNRVVSEIQTWEAEIQAQYQQSQQGWGPWLKYQSWKFTTIVYQASFIALGKELFHWVGSFLAEIFTDGPKTQLLRQTALTLVQMTVFCTTLSPILAKRARRATGILLTRQGAPILFEIVGAELGIGYSLMLGPYSLARQMLLTVIGRKLTSRFTPKITHFCTPTTETTTGYYPKISLFMKIANLTVAGIETLITKQYKHFPIALSGILGSAAATHYGKKLIPELNDSRDNRLTREQAQTLLILSLSGMSLGNGLGELCWRYGEFIHTKLTMCNMVLSQLNQASVDLPWHAASCESSFSPGFWYRSNHGLKFEWVDAKAHYHHETCTLIDQSATTIPAAFIMDCPESFTTAPPLLKS